MNINVTQTKPEIESKNLGIIMDQLHHEALACRKSEVYSSYFTDAGLKNLASQLAQHHRQNFDNLCHYLDGHR